MSSEMGNGSNQSTVDWKRIVFILIGIILFALIYGSPPWPDAVDPMGKHFPLSHEGKGALAGRCGPYWKAFPPESTRKRGLSSLLARRHMVDL